MNDDLFYSKTGLALTEGFEGFRAAAYQDQGGIWTVGYGHTGHDVTASTVFTEPEAAQILAHDVQTAENAVKRFVIVALNQNEFDAMTDLTFNIGVGNFLKSTMLKYINASQFWAASDQFSAWDKCAGRVNSGLQRRRLAETQLFDLGLLPRPVTAPVTAPTQAAA